MRSLGSRSQGEYDLTEVLSKYRLRNELVWLPPGSAVSLSQDLLEPDWASPRAVIGAIVGIRLLRAYIREHLFVGRDELQSIYSVSLVSPATIRQMNPFRSALRAAGAPLPFADSAAGFIRDDVIDSGLDISVPLRTVQPVKVVQHEPSSQAVSFVLPICCCPYCFNIVLKTCAASISSNTMLIYAICAALVLARRQLHKETLMMHCPIQVKTICLVMVLSPLCQQELLCTLLLDSSAVGVVLPLTMMLARCF